MRRALVKTAVVLGLLVLVAPVAPAGKALAGDAAGGEVLRWGELPEIPPPPGRDSQAGLAGPFVGVHEDALIVAGGANFPDGLPWARLPDGSSPRKIYNREIYVLLKGGQWTTSDIKLPNGYSYGVSISTDEGLLCIGGEWREYEDGEVRKFKSDKAFAIRHVGDGGIEIDADSVPSLPKAVSAMAGARVGSHVYVAGGSDGSRETRSFWRLDLSKKGDLDAFKWETLEPWPGPPRSHLIAAAQSDGTSDCLYILSGRYNDPDRGWVPLTDSYKYAPKTGAWTKLADVGTNMSDNEPVCVMAASGIGLGANHIAIFGGAPGDLFVKVEQELPREIAALRKAGRTEEADALTAKRWDLYTNHPGFSRDVLVYHTITDTWTTMGTLPESDVGGLTVGSHVTTTAVRWGKDIVIPSGEVRPGVRTPAVRTVTIPGRRGFGFVNYSVLVVYLLAMLGMGIYFSRRQKSTDDFFKAGGRIPWWAAGVSIFGTQLSALTFMGVPAKTFATDWRYFWGNMAIVMAAPFIVLLYLPFYRRLNVTTAYEYLERRFNLAARLLGSVMFILFQFGRIGIVLFLPSLALSVVTGINVSVCILVMGLLCIVYAALGGIEAVIWTDVLQVIVLVGGGLLCLVVIAFQFPGGWDEVNDVAHAADKFRTFDFRLDITTGTFWVLLLGGFGANLFSYGADQTVVQRYLTTKDERSARRSIWLNAILCIPATLLFFMIGTALFAFFKTHPGEVTPAMTRPDGIFPWYIVTQLSPGIAGLLIAGVFAAAMSSLDSSMNSVATAVTTDFYRRFRPNAPDAKCLRLAQIVTVVIGVLGTLFALGMVRWNIKSLWDSFAMVLGLFGGGLAGLFVLAIFTRRPGGRAAVIALLGSGAVQGLLKWQSSMHTWFYAVTGLVSCVVIGVLAGMVLPPTDSEKRKDLAGLTLHSLKAVGEGHG